LGLVDGVVVGVDNFDFDPEAAGHLSRGGCLLSLVIVVSRGKSNNYVQIVHGCVGAFRTQQPNCGNSVTFVGAVQKEFGQSMLRRKAPWYIGWPSPLNECYRGCNNAANG